MDAETSLHKLAVPLGHAPVTGMGLVLNGGVGVASKVFGPASDHIVEVTIVTSQGDVVRSCPHTDDVIIDEAFGQTGRVTGVSMYI